MEKEGIELLIGSQIYWLVGLAVLFFIRNLIEGMVAGILVFFGGDYNSDDVVYVDGLPGRIIRVGLYKTVFFLYDISNDPYTGDARVSGGTKLVILNSALHDHKIEKPLQNLDLARYKKSPRKLNRRSDG